MSLIKQLIPNEKDNFSFLGNNAAFSSTFNYLTSNGTGGIKYNKNIKIENEVSFSIWFKMGSSKGMHLIDMRTSDTSGYQPIYIGDSKIQYHVGNSRISFEFSNSFETEKWYHLCIRAKNEAGKIECWLNGQKLNKTFTDNPLPIQGEFPLYIGSRFNSGADYFLDGQIKDVRIYNHWISDYEIKELGKGLCCHYTFDIFSNDNSAIINDVSGFNNNPISQSYITPAGESKIGSGAGYFNGTNSYVALPTSCKIEGPMSYNVWAYMDTWSSYGQNSGMRILSCTSTGGYNTEHTDGKITFACHSGVKYNNINTKIEWSSLSKGWHMFTMTFDGSRTRGYLDAQKLGESAEIFTSGKIGYNNNNTIFLGAEADSNTTTPEGNYFNGRIDDFRLYSSALSPEDIKDLYNCRMKIDNKNSIYCNEFIEMDNVTEFNNKGQIIWNSLNETAANESFLTSSGLCGRELIEY